MGSIEARFLDDVKDHKMQVLQDNGVYRHLRFKDPCRGEYWFDLVTWPGHLSITGDVDCYTFSRITDMFDFFIMKAGDFSKKKEGLSIDTCYWTEKMPIPKPEIKEFSTDEMRQVLKDHLKDYGNQDPELWEEIEEEIIEDCESSYQAHDRISSFHHEDLEGNNFEFVDSWEMDFEVYKGHYIWSLYAIVWGITKYNQFKESENV